MQLNDFIEILNENKIKYEGEITLEKTIAEMGFDSFDMTMLAFELQNNTGKELKFSASDTIADVLKKVNNE